MADFGPTLAAIATSIAGTIAAIAKDRADRKAIEKSIGDLKERLDELVETVERVRRNRGSLSGAESAIPDLQRQVASLSEQVGKLAKRVDDRDGQELILQRELGGINAKLEILLRG